MNLNKIRSFCRVLRTAVGAGLVGYAIGSGNSWFYLGVIPLLVGVCDVCPLCLFSKKCDINEN
jgi:amino acid permease